MSDLAALLLQGKGHAVKALSFSPNGSMLAVAAGVPSFHRHSQSIQDALQPQSVAGTNFNNTLEVAKSPQHHNLQNAASIRELKSKL